MPTKRVALLTCLSLLAACAPRAADHGADDVPATAPAEAAATHASAAPATPAPAEVAAPADNSDDGMPDLDELQRAQADAGCEVPNAIGDLDDIRIYCAMPTDVRSFLERENTCQHFAGEEAYDDARRAELAQASADYCEGREDRFEALYTRYYDDCALRHALNGVGRRYDLFTHTAPDHCRPQDIR